jgi:hypothetical protein
MIQIGTIARTGAGVVPKNIENGSRRIPRRIWAAATTRSLVAERGLIVSSERPTPLRPRA